VKPAPATTLPDPWDDPPGGDPYAILAEAGITPDSPLAEVRAAFLELMTLGAIDDRARGAYDQLRLIGRRLARDAMRYDAETVAELLGMLQGPPEEVPPDVPLEKWVPFSWDV
jgi:hypothetical protein